jgi:hypothetical protein
VAISVLDVRDTVEPLRFRVPSLRVVPAPAATARRLPVTVLAAGLIGILESVGVLAVALTGLDGVLAGPVRPAGWIVAVGVLFLAGWIVLSAGGGAALIDGAGRRLVLAVAYAELALLGGVGVVATTTGLIAAAPAGLPLPLWLLLGAALPIGKLLLVGAPSAVRWIADGPRVRERRVDPVAAHRVLATATLGFIGFALAALAVTTPVQDGGSNAPASAVFSQH